MNWYQKSQKSNKKSNKQGVKLMASVGCNSKSCVTPLIKAWSQNTTQKKKKKPYRVVRINRGMETKLDYPSIFAFSPPQARRLFLQRYPRLKDDMAMGFDIEVVFDREKYKEMQQIDEAYRQEQAEKKIKEDESVQQQWWNK
jgi:hypothetical protein